MSRRTRHLDSFNSLFPYLLLLPFFLGKVGKVLIIILSLIGNSLCFTAVFLTRFLSHLFKKLPQDYSLPPNIFHSKKHRGRPKKARSLLTTFQRYYKAGNSFFIRLAPKPIRIGIVLGVMVSIVFSYSVALIDLAHNLPSPDSLSNERTPLTTRIYDRNNKLLFEVYDDKDRKLVELTDIPQNLVNATVAIEDKNFFHHSGIDIEGILRAIKTDFITRDGYQGGSTITQQLIKNTLLTTDQTFSRKIKEMVLAFWAERIFSKNQILKMYFNEVPYGGIAWGAQAASQMYFGKDVKDLNLAESAFLAGLPASPTDYSPFGLHPERGKDRQAEVLRRMVEDGYISKEQADQAFSQPLTFAPPSHKILAPHFVMYVKSLLEQKYGTKMVSEGGLQVVTSLDLDIQTMAEQVVADQIKNLSDLQVGNGAAMVTEGKTGHILAMVGSKDYYDPKIGNFNVTLALRQPGSSIKPITYVTGFKQGFSPGSIILDNPTTFTNPWGQSYSPVNYDGRFHGPVTVRTALGSSFNIPAVKMLQMVGVSNMIQTAKDMGITTFTKPQDYGLSLTLGGGAVRMIDMMSVYNTFSQLGMKYPVSPILKVTDWAGNVLEDNTDPKGQQVVTPEQAYLIASILSDSQARVPAFGPHSLLEIKDHPHVAVKTGTSDDKRDNWAFGYTPDYVVGVWVGNNDYSKMDPALTSGITGATPIWHDIMSNLLSDRKDLAFQKPAGITELVMNGRKDLAISGSPHQNNLGLDKPQGSKKPQDTPGTITFSDSFSWGKPVTAPQP